MPNVIDYIAWRGDLSFEADPFNEVDNLVFSYCAYVNLDGIAPGPGEPGITIRELSGKFFHKYNEEELKADHSFIRHAPSVLKAMGESQRFGGLTARNYVNWIIEEKSMQFSAVQFLLPEGGCYVAFRGTDNTILGWKEDFLLSGGIVKAQKEAVKYLNAAAGETKGKILVGGHSKGGNLAVYAAAFCDPSVRCRVEHVFSNDGPGFLNETMLTKSYQEIRERITRIIPESSVIGMLMGHQTTPEIIKSDSRGVLQHDGFSWQIMGNGFLKANSLTDNAVYLGDVIDEWIAGIDRKKRISFVEDFFSVLEAPGVETVSELQDGFLKYLPVMKKRLDTMEPANREIMEKLFWVFFEHFSEKIQSSIQSKKRIYKKTLRLKKKTES